MIWKRKWSINEMFRIPAFTEPVTNGSFSQFSNLFNLIKYNYLEFWNTYFSIFFDRSSFSNGNLSIVIHFFSGGTPYPIINNNDLIGKLKSGYRMERPENCAQPLCVLFVIVLLHYTDFFYILRSYFSLKYLLMYNSQIFKQI